VTKVRAGIILLSVLLLLSVPQSAIAKRDIQGEIDQIKHEKQKLLTVRQQLESQLNMLGKSLLVLDKKLLQAREQSREAADNFKKSDEKVSSLTAKVNALKHQIDVLERKMRHEISMAWMRAGREPGWPDMFAGVAVTEIPHRKHMAKVILDQQGSTRDQWQQTILILQEAQQQLQAERDVLADRLEAKKSAELALDEQFSAKKKHLGEVKSDKQKQQQRERELEKQEKALQRMLEDLQFSLLQTDKEVRHTSLRTKKGRLSWPIQGKLIALYDSKTRYQSSRIRGVLLAPLSSSKTFRQVRSVADGQVRYADWFGGFGLMMIVEHGDGMMTIYAHNDALYKQVGDWVDANEILAEAGSTGWVDATQLYFELRDQGEPVNPKLWMKN